jgi:hypothetical protein
VFTLFLACSSLPLFVPEPVIHFANRGGAGTIIKYISHQNEKQKHCTASKVDQASENPTDMTAFLERIWVLK